MYFPFIGMTEEQLRQLEEMGVDVSNVQPGSSSKNVFDLDKDSEEAWEEFLELVEKRANVRAKQLAKKEENEDE